MAAAGTTAQRDADTIDDLIAPRRSRPGQRTRYDPPSAKSRASRLPGHTDPEDIDDPAVREAFIKRMEHEFGTGELGEETDPNASQPSRPPRPTRRAAEGNAFTPARVASTLEVGDSIGSALLGVLAYALLLNYVQGGWSQVRRWIAAKATNGSGKLP